MLGRAHRPLEPMPALGDACPEADDIVAFVGGTDDDPPTSVETRIVGALLDEHRTARERAGLTPGEVAGLRRQAAELDFTAGELAAAEDFAELARADEPGLAGTSGERRPAAIAQRIARMRAQSDGHAAPRC
jgi:hypothetical protein